MLCGHNRHDFDRTKLSRPRLTICLIQINPAWFGFSPIDIYSRVIKTGDVVSLYFLSTQDPGCHPIWEELGRVCLLYSKERVISHESLCASYMRSRCFLPCAYRLEVKYC